MDDILGKKIPEPALRRLCGLYGILEELENADEEIVSSRELGIRLGVKAHSIRKDISYLGEGGTIGAGYAVTHLRTLIGQELGLVSCTLTCIVGLGKLGQLFLNNQEIFGSEYKIAAGFDPSINRLETLKTAVPLYPVYELEDIVKGKSITRAILTISGEMAQGIVDRLVSNGVMGILNFSPAVVNSSNQQACIRNIDLAGEFRLLTGLVHMDSLLDNNK